MQPLFNPDLVTVTSSSRSVVVATVGEVHSPLHAAMLLLYLAKQPGIERVKGVFYPVAQTLRLYCIVPNCTFCFDAANRVQGYLGLQALRHAPSEIVHFAA